MNIFSAIFNCHEYRMRRDALIQLRTMSDRSLIDCNISPELIKEGIKAWPWQNPAEEVVCFSLENMSPARSSAQSDGLDSTQSAVKLIEEQEQKERPEQLVERNAA